MVMEVCLFFFSSSPPPPHTHPGCVARHAESLIPQPDSLVPPERKCGTGLPGKSPMLFLKFMTCTSGTQLLEINRMGMRLKAVRSQHNSSDERQ